MNKPLRHIILMLCLFASSSICVAQIDSTGELILKFNLRAISLSVTQKQQLEAFKKMHCSDTISKIKVSSASVNPTRGWNRLDKILEYLLDTTKCCFINRERVMFRTPCEMEIETVSVQWWDEDEGPNMVPAPHPKNIKQ